MEQSPKKPNLGSSGVRIDDGRVLPHSKIKVPMPKVNPPRSGPLPKQPKTK